MPSITRRRLVVTGAALAGGGYAGYRLFKGTTDAEFDDWKPDRGTWPLPRYDPANTAHNPHARPPRDAPSRRTLTSLETPGIADYPLVDSSRLVYVGSGLFTSPRNSDAWTSITDARIQYTGIDSTGRLHAVERANPTDVAFDLVGYDDTSEVYRVSLGDGFPDGFTVGGTEVYVGTPSGNIIAVEENSQNWQTHGAVIALAGGRLYSVSSDDVAAYGERSGMKRHVAAGPKQLWEGQSPSRWETYQPAIADGRLVVGTFGPLSESGAVVAYDTETGEQLWARQKLGQNVRTPAIKDDRGVTAVVEDGTGTGAVVAFDLTSGDELWSDDLDWSPIQSVIGGETVVVLGRKRNDDEQTSGRVRGYDTFSGKILWTAQFKSQAMTRPGIALVDDRVLFTSDGTVYELT